MSLLLLDLKLIAIDFRLWAINILKQYSVKGYLIDTCLNSQDNYEKMANYFLEDNE